MKNSLFNPENWLWKPFGWVADLLVLSTMWLLSSLPLFTLGAACTATYDCAARCVKQGQPELFSRYFRTFRRELVPALFSFLLWAAPLSLVYLFLRRFAAGAADSAAVAATYTILVLLGFAVGMFSWVFPLLSRFTFRVAALNTTALRLALAHPLRTLLLAAIHLLGGYVCIRFWVPVLVVPGLVSILSAHILEPVLQKYEEPQAA